MSRALPLLLGLASSMLVSCAAPGWGSRSAGSAAPPAPQTSDGQRPPLAGYVLRWHDEFDGEQIDPGKWKPWALGPRRDAVNTADAARLDGDGHLVITTSRVRRADGATEYQTGGVWTQGLFEPCFGYLEARIKVHTQLGHWGAFWLNCGGMGTPVGDPASAGVEIDIMEFHHRLGGRVQQTLHWDGYGTDHKSRGHTPLVQHIGDGFHTYGLLWTADEYVFFVDGVETWRVASKEKGPISRRPEYLILSLEVGKWAGEISEATLPDSMLVDWVRVWQLRE
ncbi:MAG: Glucan endo-1,3-beta-glucosidase A1 [Phycisphaerae bacterium]|nr:Glucan endo-1,3-beta-glucosidase A1 [Phycisphaerae bacterium]